MKKVLIFISLAMILLVSVPSSLAYFYTYTKAEGQISVHLEDKTELKEEFKDGMKKVTFSADDNSDPVFIRAKAFTTGNIPIDYDLSEGWSAGSDGYYYYANPVDGKSDTAMPKDANPFNVTITYPAEAKDGDTHNVVVIHEATAALFSETEPEAPYKWFDEELGGYWYTDWSTVLVEGGE